MIGCWVAWKCLVAWRFGELSQHPTWPQVRQTRRWTHGDPIARHSSQPSALGVTVRMPATWGQTSGMGSSREKLVQRRHHLGSFADRRGDPLGRPGADVADREDAVA